MRANWPNLKNKILGKSYQLSVVEADDSLMKKLNSQYREKKKTTNVLSFPIEKNLGEIFINKSLARKEAGRGKISFGDYLDYLFVHSLLHLKGFDHGKKMEDEEQKILNKKTKK